MHRQRDIANFFIAGINYKKSDAAVRGLYAINQEQYGHVLSLAPGFGVKEFFILSTCNRTEIYGFGDSAGQLAELLCSQTQGSFSAFMEMAYMKNGREAIEHLFQVAAGLDSQILGDYEIIGQIKKAVKFSKENNYVGAYLERMINDVLQSSKEIKTSTGLSGGTVSVSFAAVQYIKENILQVKDKKILLIGTGKIGRNTCKNLVDYLGTKNITLVNRTDEKASRLAAEMGLRFASAGNLADEIRQSDIILTATNAIEPVILRTHVENNGDKLIIDLSIPYNVEAAARELPNITLVNVDELSKIKDETLQNRQAEVPKANKIIARHIEEFMEWHQMRRHVPVLKAVKTKLEELHNCHLYTSYSTRYTSEPVQNDKVRIQKIINGMAVKMREQNQRGCNYIEAINEYIATGTN